jgi:uncharacterized protein
MNQTTAYPEYSEINDALNKTGATLPAAEAHGLMCGVICATRDENNPEWEKLVLGNKKNQAAKNILRQLYISSHSQISHFALEFTLVLPDDAVDINERAEALGIWCQGFLVGLQQGTLTLSDKAEPEAAEALHDIAEIAQVSYGDIASAEEDETAYVELVEYVRLAVLMLYHEFRNLPPVTTQLHGGQLH